MAITSGALTPLYAVIFNPESIQQPVDDAQFQALADGPTFNRSDPRSSLKPASTNGSTEDGCSCSDGGRAGTGLSATAAPWPALPSSVSGGARDEALAREWRGGFIFFCRHESFRETMERRVFGLAVHKKDLIAQVSDGTALFLFDQTFRYLHGVFKASGPPGVDLDPHYLRKGDGRGAASSPFTVQVRFTKLHDFPPLAEQKFCHLLNYQPGTNVFRHKLGEREVHQLLGLLDRPEDAPKDNALPYETNGYKKIAENPRFLEQRRLAYGE